MAFFFSNLLNKKTQISHTISLDESHVRYLSISKKPEGLRLEGYAEYYLNDHKYVDNPYFRQDNILISYLQKIKQNWNVKKVNLLINDNEGYRFSSYIPIEKYTKKEIENHIRGYIARNTNLINTDIIIEYEILSANPRGVEIYAKIVPRTLIKKYVHLFKKAGIKINSLDFIGEGVSYLCRHLNQKGGSFVVDVGSTLTKIFIVSDGYITEESYLNIGYHQLINQIINRYKLSPKDASIFLKKYGVSHNHIDQELKRDLHFILEPIINKINTLYYNWYQKSYKNKLERSGLSRIYLTGESSHLKGMQEFILENTRIPTEHLDVWVKFHEYLPNYIPELEKHAGQRFAPHCGACYENLYSHSR